jgi:hypothetical protein
MLYVWPPMGEQSPTQRASAEMAEAVFANPDLRHRFKIMAKETATRDPVPDDFAWLSRGAAPSVSPTALDKQSSLDHLGELVRRIASVPKGEIDRPR